MGPWAKVGLLLIGKYQLTNCILRLTWRVQLGDGLVDHVLCGGGALCVIRDESRHSSLGILYVILRCFYGDSTGAKHLCTGAKHLCA